MIIVSFGTENFMTEPLIYLWVVSIGSNYIFDNERASLQEVKPKCKYAFTSNVAISFCIITSFFLFIYEYIHRTYVSEMRSEPYKTFLFPLTPSTSSMWLRPYFWDVCVCVRVCACVCVRACVRARARERESVKVNNWRWLCVHTRARTHTHTQSPAIIVSSLG